MLKLIYILYTSAHYSQDFTINIALLPEMEHVCVNVYDIVFVAVES